MAFLGFTMVYMLRVNLSVALIAMVLNKKSGESTNDECPVTHHANKTDRVSHAMTSFNIII